MGNRALGAVATMLLSTFAASCGVLAKPVSNDGSDANNPIGANPGTQVLTVSVARSVLMVGDTVSITGTLGGAALMNNGLLTTVSSDPNVASVGGPVVFARSVGTVQIIVTYSGYQSSPIGVSVTPTSSGVSAAVSVQNTQPAAFVPSSVTLKVGSTVQFAPGAQHNVTFDNVPGAPQNVASGANLALRTFLTAGSFTYSCTLHGETGVINVTP